MTKRAAAKKTDEARSVAQILVVHQQDLLDDWLENIHALAGNRTLELMSEVQLRAQTKDLLAALTTAFEAEQYDDIEAPEFADSIALLRDISTSRARQQFSITETATFVFSLKDALLRFLQQEMGDDPMLLAAEITKMNAVIDRLGMVTVETYSQTRETLIGEQSRAMMELSTPIMILWDEILLLPIVGTVDSRRAQMIMQTILEKVSEMEARIVILDILGVPTVDSAVSAHLLKISRAAHLMGCKCIMSGLSPRIAESLVLLGVDLGDLITTSTVRKALGVAFEMQDLEVRAPVGGPRQKAA